MTVQFNPSITQGAAFQRSNGVEQFGKIVEKRLGNASLEGGQRKTDEISEVAKQRIAAFDMKKFAEHLA